MTDLTTPDTSTKHIYEPVAVDYAALANKQRCANKACDKLTDKNDLVWVKRICDRVQCCTECAKAILLAQAKMNDYLERTRASYAGVK